MKKTLLLVVLMLVMSSMGWAGACASGTLAEYTATGFSCTIGDKTFSDFSYTGTGSGGAMAIPASGVNVAPLPGDKIGLLFSAGWNVGPGQGLDSLIGYTVMSSGPPIISAFLSMGGFGTSPDGTVSVAENLKNGANLLVFQNSSGTVSSAMATFAPVSSLTIEFKDIAVNGHSHGTAAVSAVTNSFGQVPEPASMLLFGSGLLALGGYIRRRKS